MNKFIVIDGLDGSGKDTQILLLAEMYKKQGRDVTIRSHPCDDNRYGRKSKQALLKTGKINHVPTSDCMFFLDVSPEESLRRIGSRNEDTEMFENIESLRESRLKSQKFTYNWNVIPGDDAPEVISQKIIAKCLESDS